MFQKITYYNCSTVEKVTPNFRLRCAGDAQWSLAVIYKPSLHSAFPLLHFSLTALLQMLELKGLSSSFLWASDEDWWSPVFTTG